MSKYSQRLSIFAFLRDHTGLISILIGVSALAAILEAAGIAAIFPVFQGGSSSANSGLPFILRLFYSAFADMSLAQRLQAGMCVLFFTTLARCACLWANIRLSAGLRVIVMKHLRLRCIDQMMKAGLSFLNRQRGSDFQLIIDGYTNSTAAAIVSLIASAVPMVMSLIFLSGLLFLMSWPLMLLALGLVGLVSWLLSAISHRITAASHELIEAGYSFNKAVFDVINGMKLIRLFSREQYVAGQFERSVDRFNTADLRVTCLTGIVPPLFETMGVGILTVIVLAGTVLLASAAGDGGLGILLTFLVVLLRMITPVKLLNQTRATIISKLPALDELVKFLNPSDKKYISDGTKVFDGLKSGIEFKGAGFSYETGKGPVLDHFSLLIPKGTRVGLVGASGAGKTTVTDLLFRFYDPQSGSILIDGHELRSYTLASWRARIGFVTQDTFLFNDTIRANIAFAHPLAGEEQIIKAAQRAHIHEFIMTLPKGYDTLVGDRGVLLSGGQRQRLAIARAILMEPDILVLDEATSALDTSSEQNIQKTLDEITVGKTVIAIAHRLSTLSNFDVIAVMSHGKVIESGPLQQLLAKDSIYAGLVKQQMIGLEV